jgi:hypothetical protein
MHVHVLKFIVPLSAYRRIWSLAIGGHKVHPATVGAISLRHFDVIVVICGELSPTSEIFSAQTRPASEFETATTCTYAGCSNN